MYNYLAASLNHLYREAYNIAYEMAKMTEKAYQFETGDETAIFIAGDNWQYDRAGLLAGERLTVQLQRMEKIFIENNFRKPEITQTFSLAMLNSSELIKLRQTGSCIIQIPEIAYEMLYPGHYRRLIRSVRLTVPCVLGPFMNISARLTLLRGMIEDSDQTPLKRYPASENTSIIASGALNDTGMFDFNFRDERYLPFEGAGAISEWLLELPTTFRSFNYDTISDVLLTLSYTAVEGNRTDAEEKLITLFTDYCTTNGMVRLFSLRHDFPNAFHSLFNPQSGNLQNCEFVIGSARFPYFLQDKEIVILQTKIYLKPMPGKSITIPVGMKIDDLNISWENGEDISFTGSDGNINKIKGGIAVLTGSPVRTWNINAGQSGLIKEEIDDILILLKYRI
jgi:hypothetical protein